MRYLAVVLFLFILSVNASAQFRVMGKVFDVKDSSALVGVAVKLTDLSDTTKFMGTATDPSGRFRFDEVPLGEYEIKVVYLSYKTFIKKVTVSDKDVRVRVRMEPDALMLKNVDINAIQTRVTQKGDTSEIHADAYKVNVDATTEDLLKKMPGISVENGTLKAQGEDVKKVLIDGKEFFGDDPSLAVKNIPAEIVDKIQVFDKLSDQSQFTGFNDGNTSKTINIITKNGKSNGTFGKVYGGYGTDGKNDRYQGGGNYNNFNGDRKISILGMSNNINQQNFTSQDLLGVMSSSGGGGRGGGRMGGSAPAAANFSTGQQSGINTTNSYGINFTDQWGKKIKFTGSYFFNNINNSNESFTTRNYFINVGGGQQYQEHSTSTNNNFNHRVNIRLQYDVDSNNTIIFTPQLSLQNNKTTTGLAGITSYKDFGVISNLTNATDAITKGYSTNDNLLLMHKFKKQGRTISFNAGVSVNDKSGNSGLNSTSNYYEMTDSVATVDQKTTTGSYSNTLSGSLMFTEPIKKGGQFYMNYSPSYMKSNSDKTTNKKDSLSENYNRLDSVLSNRFDNNIITQRGGFGLRIRKSKLMGNFGVDYQNLYLTGSELFPVSFNVGKTFNSILPKAMMRYSFSKTTQLRMFYRTSTDAPSISQLQNVIDNSNPQYLSTGNPLLNQQYNQSLMFRFNKTNTEKGRMLFVFVNGTATQNYIATSTFIAVKDTFLTNNVLLARGSQLSKPVNLNDYYGFRSMINYGFPLKWIKCNFNVNAGFNFQHSPGMINNTINYSSTYSYTGGAVLSSNISEKVDFTFGYTPNYTVVQNTIQTSSNNNYYIGTASARLNVQPWKGLVFTTEATSYSYVGLSSSYNIQFTLWNAAVGYKFLKNKAADIRLSVFDILKQNNSITRTVTETYVEDLQTKILQQYFMLTFTYNFKKFSGKEPTLDGDDHRWHGPPGPGGPPMHPPGG